MRTRGLIALKDPPCGAAAQDQLDTLVPASGQEEDRTTACSDQAVAPREHLC